MTSALWQLVRTQWQYYDGSPGSCHPEMCKPRVVNQRSAGYLYIFSASQLLSACTVALGSFAYLTPFLHMLPFRPADEVSRAYRTGKTPDRAKRHGRLHQRWLGSIPKTTYCINQRTSQLRRAHLEHICVKLAKMATDIRRREQTDFSDSSTSCLN